MDQGFFIFGRKVIMDIYIIRKCKVEMKEFPGSNGNKYLLPVMTREDIYSYVIKKALDPVQRDKLQQKLENFYRGGEKDER